tara:strand:+ start:39475 stop:39987 length:513 start_codon:yes stop_codon:yes gene_type:complete
MRFIPNFLIALAIVITATVLLTPNGYAQKLLSKHGDWSAYTMTENGRKVCYMFSRPKKEEGNYKRRGEPYTMVTRRKGIPEDVSVTSGYPYKEGSAAKVTIDGKVYKFSTVQDEYAWSDDSKKDPLIIKAMAKGLTLKVRGTSKKNTYSLDSYSLKGFTATYKKIKKACP